MKLQDVKNEFEKYIVVKDKWILDVVLANMIGNLIIINDPVWTMIVAPSSGGKSTVIAPCVGVPSVYFVDDLTEKTLLSGFKVKGKETSFLKVIGSGIMAFSDFTSILMKNPMSRGEILTQLKLVYDGKVSKRTGTVETAWEGKIGFIGAATPDIYHLLESGRSMGERFLYYWMDQPTDDEISAKQTEARISSKEILEKMRPLYHQYCVDIAAYKQKYGLPPLQVNEEQRDRVRNAAKFCVNGKATVHTAFKTGKVDQMPNKAGVGRDNKMFDTMLHALQIMDAYESDDITKTISDNRIDLIEKCAYSSINRERRKILEIMATSDGPKSASEIGATKSLGFEKESVELYLIPLHSVGMIGKEAGGSGKAHTWYLKDEKMKEFILRASGAEEEVEIEEEIPL